ncbi:DNA cytosine methyltransferase [Candidatus Parcubacteria bacterium]|nr:DNA cytosine methyltransferase [Patescibacteria group bacterium]MBU4309681.1 DNA cytosine methyltransferase [Patescibacteria group bacterium]MBU4431695.1 DNA cytosine methyltransferase [Patescibacteria group bacterium]MBU4577931.1 DNA cytosine methyltransferase [Patescibacteria group bacterium]MCG2696560.1 DNA cytosine methyltransferase [Candidatus Parcubacteria bacterium]
MSTKKLNVIELFSGCGGFSCGFTQAGFNILVGVDHDQPSLDTFLFNHDGAKALKLDLSDDKAIEEIINAKGEKRVDVIIAGPPCQGFSLSGTRLKDDKRNVLFNAVFDLAEKIKPRAVIIENVPGLETLYGGVAKKRILERYEELGYTVNSKVLFAPDYGVPQIRKRIVFVGLLKKYGKFEFPEPSHKPTDYVTCEQAISDLSDLVDDIGNEKDKYSKKAKSSYQVLMRGDEKILYNHVGTKHTKEVINVISQVPEGGNHKDLPKGVGESRKFNEAWTRYHSKKPSKTIDTGHRNHFHYKHNRVPTIRENARLQSFPDSFVFKGVKTQQNKQVGNAVPPLLAKALADELLKYLNYEK